MPAVLTGSLKRAEITENIGDFFFQGKSKLSVVMRCPHEGGLRPENPSKLLSSLNRSKRLKAK